MTKVQADTGPRNETRPRVSYAEAGAGMREMIDRLMAAEETQPVDLKVALAVLKYTASWSKTGDFVYRDQIAEAVGCHPQTAGKSLSRLARLGVIAWRPTKRPGGRSWLSLLGHETAPVSSPRDDETTHETIPVSSHETTEVSQPRSPSREEGTPLPPRSVQDLLAPWRARFRVTSRDEERVIGLVADGWSQDDLRWLLANRVDTARGIGGLRWRLNQAAAHNSAQSARRDAALARAVSRHAGGPPSTTFTGPPGIVSWDDSETYAPDGSPAASGTTRSGVDMW